MKCCLPHEILHYTDTASGSGALIIVEELGLLRGDLDNAGLAFLHILGDIGAPERELPHVCQDIADSTGRQEVLACSSKVIGTLYLLLRSHAGPASDPYDLVG